VDYAAHVEQLARSTVVERECAYCREIVDGSATYYVPNTDEVNIAGAMIEHLK
jgi:hypothetical protein